MISYVVGTLFESPAQTLVNTVNTVGVMGKGIALTFKKIYPDMYREYRRMCEEGELRIGRLHLYRTANKLVLNFPTKTTWRKPSHPDYIRAGLETFCSAYSEVGIHSVAFPPLGCGNGELDFESTVRPIMEEYLRDLPIPVFIYAPHPRIEPAEHRVPKAMAEWLRSSPRELSFHEVWGDIVRLLTQARELETLTRGRKFEAQYLSEKDAVRIWSPGKTLTVEAETFMELWQHLRSRGVLSAGSMPEDWVRASSHLFPILAELPYIRVITVGEDYEVFSANPTTALQLVPPAEKREEQTSLELV